MLSGCTKVLLTAIVLLSACSVSRLNHAPESAAGLGTDRTSQVEPWLEDRPRLLVVESANSSASALAFAARTAAPPVANYALAIILRRRLAKLSSAAEVNASSFGLSLAVLIDNPKQAADAATQIQSAVSAAIGPKQLDTTVLTQLRSHFGSDTASSPAQIGLAHCSGEIYWDSSQTVALVDKSKLVAWIEMARRQVYTPSRASFSVVGSREIASSVRKVISNQRPWPNNDRIERPILETQENAASTTTDRGTEWRLSFAWTVGSSRKAISAWRAMRSSGSVLQAQLAALDTDWKLDSISAVTRPVGACLRLDLSLSRAVPSPTTGDIERISRVVAHESRIAIDTAKGWEAGQLAMFGESDPRLLAKRTAWQSLSVEIPDTQPRLRANLRVPTAAGSSTAAESALKAGLSLKYTSPVETRYKLESGPEEQWVLLASTCGTAAELTRNAGSTAAWLRSLARRYTGHKGIHLEPWIAPDGIGLLAHATRQDPTETAGTMSTRIGSALGSVLATGIITSSDLAITREDTLVRIGTFPRPAWWQILDSLAPQRPSLYEPLGSFDSVRRFTLAELLASRRRWLREPLRAAVLTNRTGAQASLVNAALNRWLEPQRDRLEQCEKQPEDPTADAELQSGTRSPDATAASAYFAIHLAGDSSSNAEYAFWLEWLLNRPDGWLDQLLISSTVSRAAKAIVRGPRNRRVLVFEISSADYASTTEALARIRSLLVRLGTSGPSSAELDLAYEWSRRSSQQAKLDPRNRLVDLWLGTSRSPQPSKVEFSRYVVESLASAPATVLRVRY